MARKSWADLLEEEEEALPPPTPARPPPRLRVKQNPVTPFLAARTMYNDIRAGSVSEDLAIRLAKHLESISPAGAELLWTWVRSQAPEPNRGI